MTTALYRQTCFEISRLLTKRYSTSFSWGIEAFPKEIRNAVYAIYGFVRVADEIVDSFQQIDKSKIFQQFRNEVYAAIENRVATNPVLEAFQLTVHEYRIPRQYIAAFQRSMEMDLTMTRHTPESYQEYVYGSAEAVGLMCLKIFCRNDDGLFQELTEPARKLGAAFQKVNFLRDLKADFEERQRIYFPGINDIRGFDADRKKKIETEIIQDFRQALVGIPKLPSYARLAVFSVYLYYTELFARLRAVEPEVLLAKRIRVPDGKKLLLLIKASWLVRSGKFPANLPEA